MPFAIGHHKVNDFDTWKPIFDSDNERRESMGIKVLNVYRAIEDPNEVHMLFEVDNPEAMRQMMSSPELAETMQQAGVISKPEMTFLDRA